MNKSRREQITKAIELIDAAKSLIDTAADEERSYYDNMPESIQSGEKGDLASEAADALEQASSDLDDIVDAINNAIG